MEVEVDGEVFRPEFISTPNISPCYKNRVY